MLAFLFEYAFGNFSVKINCKITVPNFIALLPGPRYCCILICTWLGAYQCCQVPILAFDVVPDNSYRFL